MAMTVQQANDYLSGKTSTSGMTAIKKRNLLRDARTVINTPTATVNSNNNVYKPPSGTIKTSGSTGSTNGVVSGPTNYTGPNSFTGSSNTTKTTTSPYLLSNPDYKSAASSQSGGTYNAPRVSGTLVPSGNIMDVKPQVEEVQKETVNDTQVDPYLAKISELEKTLADMKEKESQIPEGYQSQYGMADVDAKYKQIEDLYKNYDPTKDPMFNDMANRTTSLMLQRYGARGLGGADFAQGAMSKANLQLGLDFKKQAMGDLYNQLGTLQGMDTTNYGRYRDAVGDYTNNLNTAIGTEQTQYNRGMDTRDMQIADYGFALTPQTQQLTQTYQSLTPDQINYTRQYETNYAARMNQLDPNSQEYQILNAARFNKILTNFAQDPETYGKYLIQDYGLAPNQIQQMIANSQLSTSEVMLNQAKVTTEQFKSYIEQVKAQYTDDTTRAELEKIQAQADKANTDALMAQIEASYLPPQLKQELALTAAKVTTEYSRANKEAAYAEKAQADLQDLSPQTQAYYGDYLEARKQTPNLSPDQYLISVDSYKIIDDPNNPGRQIEQPVRKIDLMSNKAWQEFVKYATPEEDIAATISRLKATLGGG